MASDEQQILKLFEDGDRALVAADVSELSRIFADDYLQYDETGDVFTKQDVLNNLKTGVIRYLSMSSTGRRIRLLSQDRLPGARRLLGGVRSCSRLHGPR